MTGKGLRHAAFVVSLIMLFAVSTHGCLDVGDAFKTKKVVQVNARIGEVPREDGVIPKIMIIDATTREINLLKYPKDIPTNLPGMYVHVIHTSHRIDYWSSVPYTGPGDYEITVGLRTLPPEGSDVRVIVTVNNEDGDRIAVNETKIVI
ncbi:MAG: hypothetical protein EF813_00485 [Methanosarcinales archaeon]|nr:MAG: hypothetical protein EF813_00485 [Methanosarcinales archaeon]